MEIISASIIAFISTNIDDVFLLILFFGNKNFKDREIIAGQYLGIITLIAISTAISLIGLVIDKAYIGLLGFLPIYIGVRNIIRLTTRHNDAEENSPSTSNKGNILTVAGVTIANGGDNIGIYVPLLAALAWPHKLTMISIFLAMTAIWCWLAKYLITRPLIASIINKYAHILTPFVLINLGIYILYQSKTWSQLAF